MGQARFPPGSMDKTTLWRERERLAIWACGHTLPTKLRKWVLPHYMYGWVEQFYALLRSIITEIWKRTLSTLQNYKHSYSQHHCLLYAFRPSGHVVKKNTKLNNHAKMNGSCGCCAHLGIRSAFVHTAFPSIKLEPKARLYRGHLDWPCHAQQKSVWPGAGCSWKTSGGVSSAFPRKGSMFWVWLFQTPLGDFSKDFLWARMSLIRRQTLWLLQGRYDHDKGSDKRKEKAERTF